MSKRSTGSEIKWAVFVDRDGVLNRSLVRNGRSCPLIRLWK